MKTTEEKGCYVENQCCSKCDWFAQPDFVNGVPTPQRLICPICGNRNLISVVGRYTIKTDIRFFGLSKMTQYPRFERKGA